MKTYYINLDRSHERREHMENVFGDWDPVRVKGEDGLSFSSGQYDEHGRPEWKQGARSRYKGLGLISKHALSNGLYPTELGCAISHVGAWVAFLDGSNDDYGVFLEDDCEPNRQVMQGRDPASVIEAYPEFEKADVMFLVDKDLYWNPLRVFKDGSLRSTRTLMAYTLTRRAAEILFEYVFPLTWPIDFHMSFRFFESMQRPAVKNMMPKDLCEVPLLKAYGITGKAPIVHSKHARETTFTSTGVKGWIPEDMRV